ncbi:hypothetical protein ABMY26_19035 [Azospirillum sp. HJ39]|uniref:hypothetical protein n=1 Tax=Azospirillum sp. HJ39 TaxID=3159496 RepID=UPI003556F503
MPNSGHYSGRTILEIEAGIRQFFKLHGFHSTAGPQLFHSVENTAQAHYSTGNGSPLPLPGITEALHRRTARALAIVPDNRHLSHRSTAKPSCRRPNGYVYR